ncbi:pyocin S6 family toxin immunity protein [Pseudomonas sp. FP2196]|uniref:pyocin S6 family toxin immunity protein n=1 Tax=Pseudomonas sp. FP2196 TaxID=2954086 RepID=UPI002733029A|nr:pyocin S6 family toxin immunity protein [Pseudomonas sp. FP2196]WLH36908.1 pyocin S6 family toxin immunity protein [Pseudomonas sp. FP2196]
MRYLSITGFYPDDAQDDSLQFELYIKDNEMNEKVAQLIESKPLNELEPGELLLTTDQVNALETLLKVSLPKGLEFFMGTCADY